MSLGLAEADSNSFITPHQPLSETSGTSKGRGEPMIEPVRSDMLRVTSAEVGTVSRDV